MRAWHQEEESDNPDVNIMQIGICHHRMHFVHLLGRLRPWFSAGVVGSPGKFAALL